MGMYTELIFGASLKSDTPKEVIDIIKVLFDPENKPWEYTDSTPDHIFFQCNRWTSVTCGSSYYFATEPHRQIQFDDISKEYRLSSRANLKNYTNEIQHFLDWIKPYIQRGTGTREFYAVVCYEEQAEPTIHYLNEGEI